MSVQFLDLNTFCKEKGFIYPASDIYNGINGFWDYGPLGILLKNNIRDFWWKSYVLNSPLHNKRKLEIYGLDSSIIQNKLVWVASGHTEIFSDIFTDCLKTKKRYRIDQLFYVYCAIDKNFYTSVSSYDACEQKIRNKFWKEFFSKTPFEYNPSGVMSNVEFEDIYPNISFHERVCSPNASDVFTLTEPKSFNLMFETYIKPIMDGDKKAYLRPETAQGIFINFKNIINSMKAKIPFGVAQVGKAFRNEVTPRNFIFRSREFEQMEIEWFCEEESSEMWFDYWEKSRFDWWKQLLLSDNNLTKVCVPEKERAHYSSKTTDIMYNFPFGVGEIEGIAHRSNFDLTQHRKFSGKKMVYYDEKNNKKFIPHVIEPSCGLTRAVFAVLCEAYKTDRERQSGYYLHFNPIIAPVKAAFLPLNNDESETDAVYEVFKNIGKKYNSIFLDKGDIGKRYSKQDDIGTPFCFTFPINWSSNGLITVRHIADRRQETIHVNSILDFMDMALQY